MFGLSKEELLRKIDNFANDANLDNVIDLLRKGALVGQNPSMYEAVAELDDDEKAALAAETFNKCTSKEALVSDYY